VTPRTEQAAQARIPNSNTEIDIQRRLLLVYAAIMVDLLLPVATSKVNQEPVMLL
jgi:hypothetical protein